MGKFARAVAHAKNVTVDPVSVGARFVGRKSKAGALHVVHGVQSGIQAVREEEANIEMVKAAKSEAQERAEQVVTKATAPKATPRKTKPTAKTAKA
jgi:hypothetical protein